MLNGGCVEEGAGCNGIVSVYIEPIMNEKRKYYKKVKDCPGKGEAVISVSSVKDRHYVFMTDSETFGDWPAAGAACGSLREIEASQWFRGAF
ncbi:hypothetical protein [Bacillus nakamurai]|uniref:hypothetical protein n=1 Tax=Bacillus nakamurai TaxID=1793963 RepID=UPI0020C38334|nr:hypothetical protein [Bacillus nakamurai]